MKTDPIFVPYGIAALAKQKGFDEACGAYYSNWVSEEPFLLTCEVGKEVKDSQERRKNYMVSAPAYFQLMNWLREHHYEVTIHTESNVNEILGYTYQIYSPMSWPIHRVTGYPEDPGHWDYFGTCNEALAIALSALPDKI